MNNDTAIEPLRNPTRSELPSLLAELDQSGLGIAAFARARGLKAQNLYLAKRRAREATVSAPIFDQVRVSNFDANSGAYKVELSSGYKVTVPANFESSALRKLLEVLGTC